MEEESLLSSTDIPTHLMKQRAPSNVYPSSHPVGKSEDTKPHTGQKEHECWSSSHNNVASGPHIVFVHHYKAIRPSEGSTPSFLMVLHDPEGGRGGGAGRANIVIGLDGNGDGLVRM